MFLTGSRALNFWYPDDFPIKSETDWDVVSDSPIKATSIIDVAPEEHFGGESLGDSYWNVFSVEHNGEITYFRLDGWYASYDGSHFDDYFGFYEVNKVPVQVFEWHKK